MAEEDNKASDQVEGAAPAEQAQDTGPKNKVTVEEAGTLRKRIIIEVPREKLDAKFTEMFGDLGKSALVPGFRIGHAPRRLIEKRFGKEVGNDVRNSLVGEAIGAALEDLKLNTVGEPELKLEEIVLPHEGPLTFHFEVEVGPEFELPEYKGIEVKRPLAEATPEMVDKMLTNYRRAYGKLSVVDGPAAEGDVVTADVKITGEGIDVARPAMEMRVGAFQIEGIILEDLGKTLSGASAGQSRSAKVTVPAVHPTEEWRGKEVTIEFAITQVRRTELAELNDAFAAGAGYGTVEGLRQAIQARLTDDLANQQANAVQEQVAKFLMDNTKLEVPEGVASKHARSLLSRRYMDLLNRGVPQEQIDQNFQQLADSASAQAREDMKLSFILDKIATAENIDVEEAEVNSRIAALAAHSNRRPERLRQELASQGRLLEVVTAMRQDKALAKVVELAKVVDVKPEDQTAESK